jgi:hypothetical protein
VSHGLAGPAMGRASAISVAGARTLARARVIATAIALAGGLAACSPELVRTPAPSGPAHPPAPTPIASAGPTATLQLLAALGTPGDMRLVLFDGDRQTLVPRPEPDIRWVSGSRDRGLVITVGAAGRILASGPVSNGAPPAWREIAIDADARRWLGRPVADAVADPGSGALAAVAADPASGTTDGHLVILDRSGGPTLVVLLPGRWDGRAPAWFGSGRIAVATRDTVDAPGLTIVDRATGGTVRWGTVIGAFAASDDGRTIAYQDSDDRRVLVGPVEAALGGGSLDSVPIDPPVPLAAQLLLDATGRRLAIAWLDEAGDTTSYAVYARGADGWRLSRVGPLPRGTSRAVLVSLGP